MTAKYIADTIKKILSKNEGTEKGASHEGLSDLHE